MKYGIATRDSINQGAYVGVTVENGKVVAAWKWGLGHPEDGRADDLTGSAMSIENLWEYWNVYGLGEYSYCWLFDRQQSENGKLIVAIGYELNGSREPRQFRIDRELNFAG